MNSETVQRWVGANENDGILAEEEATGQCQKLLLMFMSNQSRRNSHSRNSFYAGRRLPGAVFFIVNIFNFSHESFPANLIFAPLIPILLDFLQIQSSRMSSSPFEPRSVAFMVSVGCSAAYYFALAAMFTFPGFSSQFGVLMLVSGSLAVATLISLILQIPWWSILFILLFVGGFFKLLTKLHATHGNIRRLHPRTMQPHIPLYNVIFNH